MKDFINKMQEIVENKGFELQKIGFYQIYRISEKIQMKIKKVCFFLSFLLILNFFGKKLKKTRNKRILLKIFKILKNPLKKHINFKNLFKKSQREDIRLVIIIKK